jgi:hypothetical protein
VSSTDVTAPRAPVARTALVLAVIALAGCGSSSSSSSTEATTTASAATTTTTTTTTSATTTSTTTPASTHEQFVAKLDDICKRGNQAAAQYRAEYSKAADANDYAKAASLLEQSIKAAAPYQAEMAKLMPPAEDKAAMAR